MHFPARRSLPRPIHSFQPTLTTRVAAFAATTTLALTVLAVTALAAPAGAASPTAASVIKSSKAAVTKQSSAHLSFIATSGSSKKVIEKIVADVGKSVGSEKVTEGKEVLQVKLTKKAAYISGSSTGLTSLFGLTAAQAAALGSKWEFWKSGTSQYSNLQAAVTISSLEVLIPAAKGTTVSTGNTSGVAYLLKWTSAATSSAPQLTNTLSVASGSNLPVTEISTDTSGVKVTSTVSHWGENVVERDPPTKSTIAAATASG
jgi:hypothetical protein